MAVTVYDVASPGQVSILDTLVDCIVAALGGDSETIDGTEAIEAEVTNTTTGVSYNGYVKKPEFDALNVEEVTIPQNFAGLEAEMIPPRLKYQRFRIYEVVEDEDCVTIKARHIWYDNLENYTLWKPDEDTEYTAAAACRNIMTNAVSPAKGKVASDCKKKKKGKRLDFERKNLCEAFLDPEKGLCAKFGLSMIRDNRKFYCLEEVGYDRGMVIENGKNLLGVERTESVEEVITRVAAYGKDKEGKIVWLNNNGNKYVDSSLIGDYAYPRVELLDTGYQIGKNDVTAANIQEKMLDAAQKRFTRDHIDLPSVSMTVEFLSLGDTEEYIQYRDLDKVYLYDIIHIKDTIRGYQYEAQVIGVEHDILSGMLTSVTIGELNNWDGKRKIASWQVPEVDGANIRLNSILAGALAPESVQAENIGEGVVGYAHFTSATIDALTADSIEAVTAQIHEIIAGSITANDITAGSITATEIASGTITADQIASGTITANEIASGTITAGNIAANAITSDVIAAGAITATQIASGTITATQIASGTITSDQIQAGGIVAASLAANAVTSDKIAAGAITAGKIAAGAISSGSIDTTDLAAINATLGTASIADARIQQADIDYAQITDLDAQSAYFGQAIFEEAVGGMLFVPRLMVGYAQMVAATIGDLVIKATDDNYYHLDVDPDTGAVTATQVTVTPEEAASGHTSLGQTILDTDIVAQNLSTANIYATHALMSEINANIINVDKLFAREATISKINALDLTSNTYIQSTIGNWQGSSTITQTLTGIVSRIEQVDHTNIYYSVTEPSQSGLLEGDIWIKPVGDNSWNDYLQSTWNDLNEDYNWGNVYGAYEMYAWNGSTWRKMYDSTVTRDLSTQINQNAAAILLKADKTEVNVLSGDISSLSAELEVQAGRITSAVTAIGTKARTYLSWADPTLTETVLAGDIWIKSQNDFGTWNDAKSGTWQNLKNKYTWKDALGYETYVYDGSKWILTSDRATEVYYGTLITQTEREIQLEAQARAQLGDQLVDQSARITITANQIAQEVIRATTAEDTKINKTSQYQTADAIVSAAVSQATTATGGLYIHQTEILQTADAIVQKAKEEATSAISGSYIHQTTQYQTAAQIYSAAVSQAADNADGSYIHQTSSLQTAEAIVNEAVSQAGNAAGQNYIAKTNVYQDAESIRTAAIKGSAALISPEFSSTTQYYTGNTVSYNGNIYKFTQNHKGAWNANHVTQVTESQLYLAKTETYQTADAIVSAAQSYTNGRLSNYSTISQTASAINTAVYDVAENFAEPFDTNKTYVSGVYVSYQGDMYKFNHSHVGAWNANHVDKVDMSTRLGNYSTITQTANSIATYVTNALNGYSTIEQTADAIAAYVTDALGGYSTIQQTSDAINTAVYGSATNLAPAFSSSTQYYKDDVVSYQGYTYKFKQNHKGAWNANYVTRIDVTTRLGNYSTTTQTQDAIESYVQSALGGYSTIQQTATAINTAVYGAAENLAPAFSSATQYYPDDIVCYQGYTYKFLSNHKGAWNGNHATKIDVTTRLGSYSTISQTSNAIAAYVTNHAYGIQSGIDIKAEGIEVSGGTYVKIKTGGTFTVESGKFSVDSSGNVSMTGEINASGGTIGGWTIDGTQLKSGSGTSFVRLSGTPSATYAIVAGNSTGAEAPFSVQRNGTVTIRKLLVQDPEDPTKTKEVNLFTNFNPASSVEPTEWLHQDIGTGHQHRIYVTLSNGKQFYHDFTIT